MYGNANRRLKDSAQHLQIVRPEPVHIKAAGDNSEIRITHKTIENNNFGYSNI